MKNCPSCNQSVEDSALFCPRCGERLPVYEASENIPQSAEYSEQDFQNVPNSAPNNAPNYNTQNNMYGYGQQGYAQPVNYAPQSRPGFVRAAAKVLSSPLGLAIALFYSLAVVLYYVEAIVLVVSGASYYTNMFSQYPEIAQMFSEMNIPISDIYSSAPLSFLSAATFMLITAIGMWLTYSAAKNASNNEKVRGGGLTLIKVFSIIGLVLNCILLVISVFMIIGGITLLSRSNGNTDRMAVMGSIALVAAVVILIVLIFSIILIVKEISTLNVLRSDLNGGIVKKKASAFVAVVAIIVGCLALLGVIMTIVSCIMAVLGMTDSVEVDVVSTLIDICLGIVNILYGVILFKYRGASTSAA